MAKKPSSVGKPAAAESEILSYRYAVSLPFATGDNRKVAMKIVDDCGIESLRIVGLEDSK